MKFRFLLIYIIVLIAVGSAGCYVIMNGSLSKEIPTHTTEINRCIIRLGDDWDEVSSKSDELITPDEEFDYAVIDNDSNVLIYTRDDIAKSISSATSNYDIIRDIENDGVVVGKILVHNPKAELAKQTNTKIAVFVGSLIAVTILVFVSSVAVRLITSVIAFIDATGVLMS